MSELTFADSKVLVVGGAGFVGSNLCHHLLEHEWTMERWIVDNLLSSDISNVPDDQRVSWDVVMSEDAANGVFNVSSGEGHSIKDVFEVVARYLGITPPQVPVVPPSADDAPVVVLDPGKTARVLGWQAKVSFEETINRQLRWYDAHGVTNIYSHLSAPTP